MISTTLFYGMAVFFILLFIFGLYTAYHQIILGFVASGFSVIVFGILTALSGFGRVGDTAFFMDSSDSIVSTVTYIDSAGVLLTAFSAVMMFIVFLFVLGRYIAAVVQAHNDTEEGEVCEE